MATTKQAADAPAVRVVVRGLSSESHPEAGVFDEASVSQHLSDLKAQGYRITTTLNIGVSKGDAYGLSEALTVVVLCFILELQ